MPATDCCAFQIPSFRKYRDGTARCWVFFLGIPKPDTLSMSIAKPFYVLALTFAGCYGTTLYNDDKP